MSAVADTVAALLRERFPDAEVQARRTPRGAIEAAVRIGRLWHTLHIKPATPAVVMVSEIDTFARGVVEHRDTKAQIG